MTNPMKPAWVAAACAMLFTSGVAAEETLNLYNWGDYINPAILQKFTEETGIKVTLDTYSSNDELLAKLQAGATGYDLIFPSVYMQDIMMQLGLIAQTDINKNPAFANIDPLSLRSKQDPEGAYCLPYAWGSVGIFYNEDVTGPIAGWKDFLEIPTKTGGKITMLDDMRETLAVGLIMTGSSVNSTDPAQIQAATDYLLQHKADVSAFTYDVAALITSGDIAAGAFFVGLNALTVPTDNIKYVIPAEGGTLYQENICVLEKAPNRANAIKFLEFYLRPEIASLNVEQQFNGTANIPARELIPAAIRDNPNINPPAEVVSRLQIFEDVGPAMRAYDRAWNTLRTAQ